MIRFWLHKRQWYRRHVGGVWVRYFSEICWDAVWFKLDDNETPQTFYAGPGGVVGVENYTLPVARSVR